MNQRSCDRPAAVPSGGMGSRRRIRSRVSAVLLAACFLVVPRSSAVEPEPDAARPVAEDEVGTARALARGGERAEAIRMLEGRLERAPDDTEARVLLGTVLSWEGRYDEARPLLERALADRPLHHDAVRALLNVELWSGNPERAERLADEALSATPTAPDLLVARARARSARGRREEARRDVELARSLDPRSVEGDDLFRAVAAPERRWRIGTVVYYDWFSDDRSAWKEAQVSLRRGTSWGSWIARYWTADHFDTRDDQLEFEAWPRIREGTYASLTATASIDSALVYSDFSVGGELYQSLGKGFEGSLGYRYLDFDGSGVDIWTGTIGKYFGNWFVVGRGYYVPGSASDSSSFYLQARRYFGDGTDYVAVRAGRGTYREQVRTSGDLALLSSHSFAAELWKRIGERWVLVAGAGSGRSERASLPSLRQSSVSAGLYYRF